MADLGEEEEYESDPEQGKLALNMQRRREASDDDDVGDAKVSVKEMIVDSRVSDYDSDDQGAAAEYEDEEEDLVEEVEKLLEEDEDEVEGVVEETSVNDQSNVDQFDDNANGGVGKKENEPFAVPTVGAFYMHDDRFRNSGDGRHRRTLDGKKFWELRDESKWGHDKYEEMTTQDRHYYEHRRAPRGRNRASGRNRGEGRGLPKIYKNNNQTGGPKSVRGRGPRRYQPSTQNTFESSKKQTCFRPAKPIKKTSHESSGRASAAKSASKSAQVGVRKNVVASNLNSASPPFYPSIFSNKEINLTQRKDAESESLNRGPYPPAMVENYPISHSNIGGGRNVTVSLGMDKLYINDSVSKPFNDLHTRAEVGQVAYQPVPPRNINRRNLQPSGHQFVARSASRSRASSPTKASSPAQGQPVDLESSTESNDSKSALVGKGKGSIPCSGMSSFSYGEQKFSWAPTFLPVMQFAGQHPRGLGVPAVGMVFPGYVAQPNVSTNIMMMSYPYITMDGAYNARPSSQQSSLAPPINKDNGMNKSSSDVKTSQKSELEKDELRQRQNKGRRYTEMKFDKK